MINWQAFALFLQGTLIWITKVDVRGKSFLSSYQVLKKKMFRKMRQLWSGCQVPLVVWIKTCTSKIYFNLILSAVHSMCLDLESFESLEKVPPKIVRLIFSKFFEKKKFWGQDLRFLKFSRSLAAIISVCIIYAKIFSFCMLMRIFNCFTSLFPFVSICKSNYENLTKLFFSIKNMTIAISYCFTL